MHDGDAAVLLHVFSYCVDGALPLLNCSKVCKRWCLLTEAVWQRLCVDEMDAHNVNDWDLPAGAPRPALWRHLYLWSTSRRLDLWLTLIEWTQDNEMDCFKLERDLVEGSNRPLCCRTHVYNANDYLMRSPSGNAILWFDRDMHNNIHLVLRPCRACIMEPLDNLLHTDFPRCCEGVDLLFDVDERLLNPMMRLLHDPSA
ncbi:Hypothetical protein UVM_LOCUS157 [uncultured virus]|nr:Hypothetical protein UVM_LOCUS157 [uncultured virus]